MNKRHADPVKAGKGKRLSKEHKRKIAEAIRNK